ncbi:MAG TPA: hypothetical protein PKV41_02920, partial [Candidatus Omnitrophota bacterium]|nr:hypothetical protein [Candidatus Omnitrophota bacterium]
MFQKINRALRSPLRKKKTACNGQVAIILILVIAAGLIFFAVSLNLGQFALTRAIVTIASNTSASMLASNMASYGQMLSETQLDGKLELCKWSGLAAAIVSLLAAIIGAILAVFTAGSSLAIVIAIITGVIGVGLATAAVVMQLTVQPGLTTWWNSVINETLSTSNQVTENAISAALEKAVTDAVNLPDTNDSDGDRIWADAADLASAPYADEISRYGQYYTMRLQQIKQIEPSEEIVDFIGALREFLYEGNDGWGIYDPMTADLCKGLAECHMCCVPNTLSDGTTNARPATCQNATDDNFWGALCESASPYQLSAIGTAPYAYGWLYDNFFENPYNGFFSLREWIGRDDEHKDFYKDPTGVDPNSVPGGGTPSRESQRQHADAPVSASGFRLEDTTGFYVPPYYDPFNPSVNPPTGENRKGIFPFFYKMADWGVDLSRVRGNISADLQSRECHWCDVRDAACIECAGLPPHDHPLEIPQLSLPVDPASLKYDQSYFVEGVDNAWDVANPENPPLAVDRVTIDIPGPIIATDDQCAEDFYPGALPDRGFWRRGADRFCADTCPYYGNCAKCSGADGGCQCDTRPSGADPASFPDDALDDLIYGMTDFIEDAEKLLVQAQGALVAYSSSNEEKKLAEFTSDFLNWYDDIAKYIEPGSADGVKDPDADVPCFWCDGPETIDSKYSFEGSPLSKGILYIMLDMMMGIRDRLQAWVLNVSTATGSEGENIGYPGQECTEVWCVPDATLSGRTCGANGCVIGNALPSCQIIPKEEGEQEAFNTHMTFDESDVQGDVIDIVGCLNYNVNGYDHVAAAKLKRCLRNPISANCNRETVLPNWHLDGTTPYEYPEVSFFGTPWDATNPWFRAITQN